MADRPQIIFNFRGRRVEIQTHPRGSATVTSYAPGVHPFTMARLTKREREEIEREEDEWWWISQERKRAEEERKRAEEEAMWAMWDEWDRMERMDH